ncbi:MAG: hypothetical protein NTZ11_10560 [Gammaproteobacteria bacterium]|nr:hypothetical protein [Gammaproteobacteria bacterium]
MNRPVQAKHLHRYTFSHPRENLPRNQPSTGDDMSLLIRVLFLAAVGWLLYRAYIRWQVGDRRGSRPPEPLQTVARCEGCGTYLPVQTLSPQGRCGACEQKRP